MPKTQNHKNTNKKNVIKAIVWLIASVVSLILYLVFDIGAFNILFIAASIFALLEVANRLLKIYVSINAINLEEDSKIKE